MIRYILASRSPRRRELLGQAGLTFDIIPAEGEEAVVSEDPAKTVRALARSKAEEIADGIENGDIVLPEREGISQADDWSGPETVRTEHTFHECTEVHVLPMDEEEIRSYIDSSEPYDKAGAYGIQGAFGVYISGINGDYNNVVGLPIARLYHELKRLNLLNGKPAE